MKNIENTDNWLADDGKVLVCKSNNEIMGTGLCLGSEDNISNYTEIDMPSDYTDAFIEKESKPESDRQSRSLNRRERRKRHADSDE